MRILIGLVIGIALFLVGIPVLQSIVRHFFYDPFTYQDAVLGLLLILACVIVAQLTALKPPRTYGRSDRDDRKER